jgi:hypothetical protein
LDQHPNTYFIILIEIINGNIRKCGVTRQRKKKELEKLEKPG